MKALLALILTLVTLAGHAAGPVPRASLPPAPNPLLPPLPLPAQAQLPVGAKLPPPLPAAGSTLALPGMDKPALNMGNARVISIMGKTALLRIDSQLVSVVHDKSLWLNGERLGVAVRPNGVELYRDGEPVGVIYPGFGGR